MARNGCRWWRGAVFALALVSPLVPARGFGLTSTWTGGGLDDLWTTGNNWGGTAPVSGNDLTFPSGAMQLTNFNNFMNLTAFRSIMLSGSGYTLEGQSISLTDGITNSSGGDDDIEISFRLTASQTFQVDNAGTMTKYVLLAPEGPNTLTFDGAGDHLAQGVIQDNFFTPGAQGGNVTKNGTGTLTLAAPVNGYSGATTLNDGTLLVNGINSLSSITSVLGGTLGGTGGTGNLMATGGTVNPGVGGPGILSAFGDVAFVSPATFAVELNGTTAGTDYDQLKVQFASVMHPGTVSLGNAALSVSLGFAPPVGTIFVIIDNAFNDPITGTFDGLPEGAALTVDGTRLRVSYIGGTGNDVTLEVLPPLLAAAAPALDWHGLVLSIALLAAVGILRVRLVRRSTPM